MLWIPLWLNLGSRLASSQQQPDPLLDSDSKLGGPAPEDSPSKPLPPLSPPSSVPFKLSTRYGSYLSLLARADVLAIIIAQFCNSWGLYGLISWLPTFYAQNTGGGMGATDYASGSGPGTAEVLFTVAPYLLQGACGVVSGYVGDAIIRERTFGVMTKKIVRARDDRSPTRTLAFECISIEQQCGV